MFGRRIHSYLALTAEDLSPFALYFDIMRFATPIAVQIASGLVLSASVSASFQPVLVRDCAASKLQADIRADTNRDGVVDLDGDSDVRGKREWTPDLGAIFLPAIGDTDRRCSKKLLEGPAVDNENLGHCHDASDDIMRSPQYLAPLRTVPITNAPESARGRVYIADTTQQRYVRLFYQPSSENSTWIIVSANTTFSSSQLQEGLVLGIDGRDTRRPNGWDGHVTIHFEVESPQGKSSDEVALRVAPVLIHHHLDPVEQVIAVEGNNTNSPWIERFAHDLSLAVEQAGLPEKPYLFSASDDIWAQDFMEPGYASMPGPDGPISLRIMIRSPQDERVAGRQLFEYYRNTGIGAVQHLGGARDEINSGGNIESIPPFTHDGMTWPSGRVILGDHGRQRHHIAPFLQAQEVQDPIFLDSGWLAIGHVDEFLQFLPVESERGWVVMIDDPRAGVALLRDIVAKGKGSTPAYSRKNDTSQPQCCGECLWGCQAIPVNNVTVEQLVNDEVLMKVQEACAKRIDGNIQRLKNATGITDQEIIRLPALFQNDTFGGPFGPGGPQGGTGGGRLLPRQEQSLQVGALFPGAINGLVVTGYGTYIAPNPWGPLVDGEDVLAAAVAAQYAKVGLKTVFVDDWNSHHNFGGEVHCGSNTARDMSRVWWQ